jgi:CHASE3 domain sensor protein
VSRYVNFQIIGLVLLLVVGDAVSFYYVGKAEEAGRRYEQARRTAQAVRDILGAAKDAETGQRGYLLTGREAYLEPYYAALRDISEIEEELDHSEEGRDRDVKAARRVLREKLEELARTVELRRGQSFDAAVEVVLTDRGRVLMQEMRALSARLCQARDAEAVKERAGLERSLNVIKYLRGVQTFLAVVLGVFLVSAYRRGPS